VTPPDLDVLSFGEALVDFFPERPGIPLVDCDVFHRHLGGAPANVAIALARQGARAGLMTLVGPDDFGAFVRARLAEDGVDVAGVGVHRTAKTGVTFVAVGARGERSFLFFRHPSADQMIAEHDVDPRLIERARVLHVGSSTLSREPARAATWKAIDAARAAGRLVSTDPNWRAHLWDDPREAAPLIRRLLERCAIVKISDDELQPLVGTSDVEAAAAEVRALGSAIVVVTLGARGAYFAAAGGSGFVPGERVEVVDTTGAGDAFMAGLLAELSARLAEGRSLDELSRDEVAAACARGNRLGALATTRLGATAALAPAARGARSP
jgi:fructokinase